MQAKQSVTTLVGAVILLLFALTVISFVPGTPTQALAPSMQQDPQPRVGFDKLEDSVLAGEKLNTGLFFANFPCIDQNDDGTCNSDDKFTTVTYRFDLVQGGSDGPNADHCEGQGFGSVSNFSPSQYSHWITTGAIPLSINSNCPPTSYTLKCSVTYTEPGSAEAIPLDCNCGITIGPAQEPATATPTPTETPIPTATSTETPTPTAAPPDTLHRQPRRSTLHRPRRPTQLHRQPRRSTQLHRQPRRSTQLHRQPHRPTRPHRQPHQSMRPRRQPRPPKRPYRSPNHCPRPPSGLRVCLSSSIKASKLPST